MLKLYLEDTRPELVKLMNRDDPKPDITPLTTKVKCAYELNPQIVETGI